MKTIFTKEEMMLRKGCYSEQQVDVYHIVDNDLKRMDVLTYPTKCWTWEYL